MSAFGSSTATFTGISILSVTCNVGCYSYIKVCLELDKIELLKLLDRRTLEFALFAIDSHDLGASSCWTVA